MVDKTIPELETETSTTLPDNISGQVTPATLRALIKDILENEHVTAQQIATASGTPSSSTVLYGDNTWKTPSGGGGTFTGSGDPGLSRAQAIATAFTTPPVVLRTTGYYTPGDIGGGLHVKVTTAPTDHPGFFTTADGSHYLLIAENGQVNIAQFGAQPMLDYATMPTVGGSEDCYSAFVGADRYIKSVANGGIKLIVPASATGQPWFLGRTHSLYRCSYNIEGSAGSSSVFIRTPPYQSGFMQGSGFGPLDYNFVDPNNTYTAGFAAIRRDTDPGAYNCYRCIVGGAVGSTDTVLVSSANNPAATYTWGASQWKFERNVGPTSVWDYSATPKGDIEMTYKNLTFWSFWDGRTLPDFSGGFGGSTDTAFNKWPSQDLDVAGFPRYQCGIGLRTRATVQDCHLLQYNGFGLAAAANGDSELINWTGNVDGCDFRHIVAYYNGKAGVHYAGNNGNACSMYYLDTHANGRMGLELFGFLGNYVFGIQAATDGIVFSSNKQYLSGATYNGYVWFPRLPLIGVESWPAYINEEPGAGSNHAWTRWFGDGTATYGVKGTLTGSISGTVLTVTATSLTTIAVGDMISSPSSSVRPGTKITSLGTGTGGTGTYNLTGATQTVSSTSMTVMDHTFYYNDQFEPWDPTYKYEWGGAFGSNNHNARNSIIASYQEGGINPGQLGNLDVAIGGMAQSIDASRGGTILDASGNWNNIRSYGFQFADSGKRLLSRTAVPIAGDSAAPFVNGDVVIISGAVSGSPWGYQCTVNGDPGTWKSMGNLA